MYVVSRDTDWRRACEEVPVLIHLNQLDELLEQFADSVARTAIREFLGARKEEVEELIRDEADNLDYFVSDSLIDGECDDLEVNVAVDEFHVVDADDGQAVVTAFCTLNIRAFVTADDPNSMWTDPDTGDVKSVWRLAGRIEREIERDVTLTVTYDEKHPEDVEIGSVEFGNKSVEIEVDEHELSCSNQDELDEIDIVGPDDF
jgi:hypothetical protein